MPKSLVFIFPALLVAGMLNGQPTYLERPDLLSLADSCLRNTYNFSFDRALQFQKSLYRKTPDHPAPPFLEALIIYWEHFPLTPEDPASEHFIELMDESIARAVPMMEHEGTYVEGVFFDLFGRAFKAMFWADNGKPAKIVPDLKTMYRHTMEGFGLKEEWAEFYFTTGLYNYYIEAYPEAHPVYKPLVSFMQDGDRKLGLIQLNHAIRNAVYLRVESTLFMSLIQLNYENDLKTAAIYAERLHREYPANIYYQGHLVGILLHLHRYAAVEKVIAEMDGQQDRYSQMIFALEGAFRAEMVTRDRKKAGREYQKLIGMAEKLGPMAGTFAAMGYMGLSRLSDEMGLHGDARRYERKASRHTAYRFILDARISGPG